MPAHRHHLVSPKLGETLDTGPADSAGCGGRTGSRLCRWAKECRLLRGLSCEVPAQGAGRRKRGVALWSLCLEIRMLAAFDIE
ncbi:MAG: hypothetical protein KME26_19185 [Oscillatoria princeps RMCB-10]|nr:hypothetical protein [Oscillatoria princeps RMCB-10]